MSQISKTIHAHIDINGLLNWVDSMCTKALSCGPVVVTLGREERTSEQNRKGWPMWRDLSKQVSWYGETLRDDEWKMVLTAIIKKQKSVRGIDGGFVVLAYPTSKLKKTEFSELIELTYAFGTEHNVKWSEPALKVYEEYREMSDT